MKNIFLQIQTPQLTEPINNDKMIVVVGVIAIIFVVVVAYLIHIDLRLKKQEKKNNYSKSN